MKLLSSITSPFLRALIAVLVVKSSVYGQTVIFSDDFDGDGSDLDGTAPDVTTGANWVAGPLFNTDGTTDDAAGSATLAFLPVDGFIYTLDASFSGLGLVGAGPDNDWFAAGFVNGSANINGINQRFITGEVAGTAWIMHRGDITLGTNQTFLGTGQLGTGNFGLGIGGGDNTAQAWALAPASAAVDFRVVLDTTEGEGAWKATWFAKRSEETEFIEVRATQALLPGAVISGVGLARSNSGVTGTVESFSLTSSASGPPVETLQLRIALGDQGPEIEIKAEEPQQVDLYRSTTAEPGSWGEAISNGLENGDLFIDTDPPAGRAFYIGVASGNPAP